jgi:hypothetical protein
MCCFGGDKDAMLNPYWESKVGLLKKQALMSQYMGGKRQRCSTELLSISDKAMAGWINLIVMEGNPLSIVKNKNYRDMVKYGHKFSIENV